MPQPPGPVTMEDENVPECRWKSATLKRRAWALSRDSWQGPESQDGPAGAEEVKASAEGETVRVPNKISSWLQECRTPQGASLDEQSNLLTKGLLKNGFSFEDDLSLGAEANHLRPCSTKPEPPCIDIMARERRSQFQQRGMSVNSTGSGKSNASVSSVSELLDLYEEDPEEILYNLGFGSEEPDIAAKIPPRFFSSSSHAKGIDIKVYLGAQLQRLELENPSYALTSRFRQIKVLTTVANAFSSLYSQVSGQPVEMIKNCDQAKSDVPFLKRVNPAENVAKILKRSLTKHNLTAAVESSKGTDSVSRDKNGTDVLTAQEESTNLKNEQKHHKALRKESPCLATVIEELQSNISVNDGLTSFREIDDNVELDESGSSPGCPETSGEPKQQGEEHGGTIMSVLNKESSVQHSNPRIAHLIAQPKDSFEMEEVQSNEGEGPVATRRPDSELLLRTASQHSDSSGFADDPSAEGTSNYLKVQESSDSCDSETTVTYNACDLYYRVHPVMERLPIDLELLTRDITDVENSPLPSPVISQFEFTDGKELSGDVQHPVHEPLEAKLSQTSSILGTTVQPDFAEESQPRVGSEFSEDIVSPVELILESYTKSDTNTELGPISESHVADSVDSKTDMPTTDSHSQPRLLEEVRPSISVIKHKSSSVCEESEEPVETKPQDRGRHPLRRASSLPSSLLNPCRVVSSIKIHLRPDHTTSCTTPSYSYCYTTNQEEEMKEDVSSQITVDEKKVEIPCPSVEEHEPHSSGLEEQHSRMPSHLLHVPPHLTRSCCSLHNSPSDCPQRTLGAHSRAWSTYSVPNLPPLASPYSMSYGSPNRQHNSSPSCISLHSAPYGSSHAYSQGAPYGSPFSTHPYSHTPYGVYCNPHYTAPYPCSPPMVPPTAVHTPSTTEMQLRRVLHDIRGTMQNLTQCSSLQSDSLAPRVHGSMFPLYEASIQELQGIRQSLNTFRMQMMDLELSLVRQQSMVYQHLTEEERQEARQLQHLRDAVRQELQEMELQLEDRLLALEEQLRSSHNISLYHHPMGIHRGHSMESLSTSSVNAMEPVSEGLGYQHYQKEEPVSVGVVSGSSSRSASPLRGSWPPHSHTSEHGGVYRASISLTPAPPPRPDASAPPEAASTQPQPVVPTAGERAERRPVEKAYLQQLIQEIKDSIADEVRQEILSEILSAVSPRRSLTTTREPTL